MQKEKGDYKRAISAIRAWQVRYFHGTTPITEDDRMGLSLLERIEREHSIPGAIPKSQTDHVFIDDEGLLPIG